ncbi:MAG TPA: hypothetical protein VGO47_12580 [Chlamydiales bacterium]|nr:hypothetical protein [Chlamydiales bacterium]
MNIHGSKQCFGYNIGCSHQATIRASSLGPRAEELGLHLTVNAFHGHAHNRLCQLQHHPLYTPGVGLEDFETCE